MGAMMRHTVLMPFSRPWNFEVLYEHLVDQGVEWRILCDGAVADRLPFLIGRASENKDISWLKPFVRNVPKDKDGNLLVNAGNWRLDRFLDSCRENKQFFSPDHLVSMMTDDCLWDWGHWPQVRKTAEQARARVVISAAMSPGGNIVPAVCNLRPGDPAWGNGKDTHNTLRPFVTRFEVLTVRADLLEPIRFGHCWFMDGILVSRLCHENAGAVGFNNATLVYAEALHPEKWNFPHHKLAHEGN